MKISLDYSAKKEVFIERKKAKAMLTKFKKVCRVVDKGGVVPNKNVEISMYTVFAYHPDTQEKIDNYLKDNSKWEIINK